MTCRGLAKVNWDALRLDLALTDWDSVRAAATVETIEPGVSLSGS